MSRRILAVLILLSLAVGVSLYFYWPFGQRTSLRVFGIVEVQEVRLGSKVGGRVAEVLAQEGDIVYEGKPLIAFEAPEMEATKEQWEARLVAAQADYDKMVAGARQEEREAARAAAASAQANYDKIKKGWRIEEIKQAESDMQAARSDFKRADEDLARFRESYAAKTASKAELDAAINAKDRAFGIYNAATAKFEMVKTGSRVEDVAQAKAEFERMQAKSDELAAGNRIEDINAAKARLLEVQAKLKEIEANLRESVVRAPEKCRVEVIAVRKGDILPPNQSIVKVLRQADLWVRAYVPEPYFNDAQPGTEVDVILDRGHRYKGKIVQRNTASEFTPRNVQSIDERHHQVFGIKILVPPPNDLNPGMAAEVILPLRKF